ncbi:tyrosine-protein phosphatase [Alkalicoccus saliphilus]|uniref:Tyrosine-protein phosphatase n=1 Tax=Alkalicoccus saliphilus TaxID=200989 RepID=A0A2T4U1U1_9BACI|nr:CpsB/CapC family capsule biosynthesis tyrosine phosphatase [Alkalicoccus saliphilus]PTL37367.1 tyrosine protein phosphatase [Alkalicoccus saliphilus]
MIDIHTHILPGLDDGAPTLEDAVEMAEAAAAAGITKLIATPHHQSGTFYNPGRTIKQETKKLNNELQKRNIALEVYPGQEIRLHGEIIQELQAGSAITLAASPYVLVELPEDQVPTYAANVFYDLQMAGYKPIIAHPERNEELRARPELLYRFVKNGALTQLTAGSVLGNFGRKVKRFTGDIIEARLAHFLATDAHDTAHRGFLLEEAEQTVSRKFGERTVEQWRYNAGQVLNQGGARREQPMHIKRRRLFR